MNAEAIFLFHNSLLFHIKRRNKNYLIVSKRRRRFLKAAFIYFRFAIVHKVFAISPNNKQAK